MTLVQHDRTKVDRELAKLASYCRPQATQILEELLTDYLTGNNVAGRDIWYVAQDYIRPDNWDNARAAYWKLRYAVFDLQIAERNEYRRLTGIDRGWVVEDPYFDQFTPEDEV